MFRHYPSPLRIAIYLVIAILLNAHTIAFAGGLWLGSCFGDNMVLQREKPVPVWGWALQGTEVTVTFAGQTETAVAGDDLRWQVELDAMPASAVNRELTVSTAEQTKTLTGVLVGEVWLASGQSNMALTHAQADSGGINLSSVNLPLIRYKKVGTLATSEPRVLAADPWVLYSGSDNVLSCSAVVGFFAMKLHEELGVPIGVLNVSWPNTRIEPWTPAEGFDQIPELESQANTVRENTNDPAIWQAKAEAALSAGAPPESIPLANIEPRETPGAIYNGMIHPFLGMAMRGAIWYQGESNILDGQIYEKKMQALVGGWRTLWEQGDFPFYFVQLAPYKSFSGETLATIWEAQFRAAKSITNSGMAVTTDVGDLNDIHPTQKRPVGERLALWALAKDYGRDIVYSGPLYKGFRVADNKIVIYFDHAESGLSFNGASIKDVYIKGEGDSAFVAASPTIEGSTLVVTHPSGKKPLHVRMGWNVNAEPSLTNMEGLPASPFRTDMASPVADSQSVRALKDQPKSITLTGSSADGDALTYSVMDAPANGVLDVTALPEVIYTPDPDYVGTDSFTFTANDGIVDSTPATISIDIVASNAAPVVNAGADQTSAISTSLPFSPADLSPAAWYDAADSGTITASSGTVSQWSDKSGNGNHVTQATSTARPTTGSRTLNGLNVLNFDGSDDELLDPTFASLSSLNLSIFAVQQHDRVDLQSMTAWGLGRNTSTEGLIMHSSYDSVFTFGYRYPENKPVYYTENTNAELLSYVKSGTSSQQAWVDGLSKGVQTGTVTTFTTQRLALGSRFSANYLNGAIGEFVVIPSSVSEEDRQKLEGYLAHKWGLAGSLPTNHPYKSAAPGATGTLVVLDGASVTDADGDAPSHIWTVVSAPAGATAVFDDESLVNATVSFDTVGAYVLRLTADDGIETVFDEIRITVTDGSNTLANWIGGYELGGLTGVGDDYDGDGLANALENYFGTDPSLANQGIAGSSVHTTGSATEFSFVHPLNDKPASDISARYRWSKDLSAFHEDGATDSEGTTVHFSQAAPVDGRVTVTATIEGSATDRVFVQLVVEQH